MTGADSLFQQAAKRLSQLGNATIQVAAPLIVTGEDHRFLAAEQLREADIQLGAALLEPTGRNTAPALTLAALAATDADQDPILVVTPADQTVIHTAAFTQAMQQAIAHGAGNIVILGIQPDRPETGYGYIYAPRQGEAQGTGPNPCQDVSHFVEKPDVESAQSYIQAGGYYWNVNLPKQFFCQKRINNVMLKFKRNSCRISMNLIGNLEFTFRVC